MDRPVVFVFETTDSLGDGVRSRLLCAGLEVIRTCEKAELMRALGARRAEVVILEPSMPAGLEDSLEVVRQIRESSSLVPVVLIVRNSSEDLAIAALRAGVNEYIRYPFSPDELVGAVNRCLDLPENKTQPFDLNPPPVDGIIGESEAMREIRGRVTKVALSESNVLITGETGTGKELFADVVHKKSRRGNKPFVAINCAAIPDTLLESELFGHAKGAFTGAESGSDGRLKAADQGTLFLDEIGDMSAYCQAKILRVIENKEIQRLGCNRGIPVDVRVIAATNQDLEQLSRENKFRKDLFFRLNVARIHLPPLRERKEDLPSLIDHYIGQFSRRFGRKAQRLTEDALDCLFSYDWPGNVRELKNLLESIFVECPAGDISLQDLPIELRVRCAELRSVSGDERERLLWALATTNWNKSRAAARLHWSRMTLYRKMARYNILRGQVARRSPDAESGNPKSGH
jgi:DNA-binding NtrC family response regulator